MIRETVVLEWDKDIAVTLNQEKFLFPKIKGQDFDYNSPRFYYSKNINGYTTKNMKLVVNKKQELSVNELTYIKQYNIQVSDSIFFEYKSVNSKNKRFLNLEILPFFSDNGVYYKLIEVELLYENTPYKMIKNKSFVSESVLNDKTSDWYKISVTKDGVCKVDYTFLKNIGIDLNTFNPNSFNIYGNAAGKLAESNSIPKIDDLKKNAIRFVGNSNDVFEEGEYFLFYATGPDKWNRVNTLFRRDLNIYSDFSYYFIRISSTESPLRISDINDVNLIPNRESETYNYFDIYELEKQNLISGGQRWYGDVFDLELTKTFTFNIDNIDISQPVYFISSFASNSNGSGNTITFSIDDKKLLNTSLPSTSSDYARKEVSFNTIVKNGNIPLTVSVTRSLPSFITYLDKIELNARKKLIFDGVETRFRDLNSIGFGNITDFKILNAENVNFIWDITDRLNPKNITISKINGVINLIASTDSLREFVMSNGLDFQLPNFIKKVENQNLHGLGYADLLIVTHSDFLSEAIRLSQLHLKEGVTSHVVTTEQVFNEFSSGALDPTGIKWFAKMFYDRANGDVKKIPKNLLLFGDGTFDPKNRVSNNNYFVPTYQMLSSEDHINAMVTDDYFAMLDDNESISSSDMMDMGVGRMIVSSTTQAKQMVDKVEQYLRSGLPAIDGSACSSTTNSECSSFGDWKQKIVQVADDEEDGYFVLNDSEPQSKTVASKFPFINVEKMYLDVYQQVSSAGGERCPEVFDGITDRVQRGSLLINYVGHGGEVGVAEERVVTIPQIQSWTNFCNLNVFVSATCEFTKFDDPSRVSAGEWVYLNPTGGAIALMTTTRSVYFNVNTAVGLKLFDNVFMRDENHKALTLGEIMMRTKNQANSGSNKRSFTLIGDPALRMGIPEFNIVTDSINSFSPKLFTDTIEALSKVTIKGHVEDFFGNKLTGFNGIVNPTIFDKKKTIQTLGQNADSPVIEFDIQKNILYKGTSTVKNGDFEFSFIVPKDIRYDYGVGKLSFYASSENSDAGGEEQRVVVGGLNPNGLNDLVGPDLKMYMNSTAFVNGGLTDESPTLYLELFDENGINTVGNGIGHDVMAILDDNTSNPILLNDYYSADLDTYKSGKVKYQFRDLKTGKHKLSVKVWDVNNNSSDAVLEFEVKQKDDFQLSHVLNYPNPFTTNTSFFFEHNQLCSELKVQVQIFTISGKLVKTINQLVYNECFRSDGIQWDGKDEYGDQLAKGVYVYKLKVTNPQNQTAEKVEKLVILK